MITGFQQQKASDTFPLMEALAEIRSLLMEHLEGPAADSKAEDSRSSYGTEGVLLTPTADAPYSDSPIDQLSRLFKLSRFERNLLLMCAGVEMDPAFPSLCAAAHGDSRLNFATFGLALAVLPEAHWSAITPRAPLRRWRLIEVGAGERLTSSPLRIDERMLHYLVGISCLDERLQGFLEPVETALDIPASQQDAAYRIGESWALAPEESLWPVIHLAGNDDTGKRSVAAAACLAMQFQLHSANAADLPVNTQERDLLARLWERETVLSRRALLLVDDPASDPSRTLVPFLETTQGFFIVVGREALPLRKRPVVRLEINRPIMAEQKAIWGRLLGSAEERLNGDLERVATHFDFSAHSIRAASEEFLSRWNTQNNDDPGRILWEVCRKRARSRLHDLAQRIEPAAAWNDLVLPPAQLQALRSIAAHMRQRALVYDQWGFSDLGRRGLGISALFSGASGTGKTMAAEVLANELHLDLYRIDLSAVVSKYIGETEKNLRRVFDAAEESGAILLFDEADALFGRRSEVKDSHDRYANIEVSYLLQRMESYRGLAILTSNLKHALDPAFTRRLRFIVHFPFPDTAQRIEIWKRIFPAKTPTQGLDLEKLARLNLSGGNIRNLALNAAFLAADSGEPVSMKHLLIAAQAEYAKLEKPLSDNEIGGWW